MSLPFARSGTSPRPLDPRYMSLAVDPITVSVIQHRLRAIVEEMGEAMLRTSYSQILNSSRDFSTALCGPDGRPIAQAEQVPIHVGALPSRPNRPCTSSSRGGYGQRRRLAERPLHGGNHLPDLTGSFPFSTATAWCSGRSTARTRATSAAPRTGPITPATEIFQEGIRIPPLMLYERGGGARTSTR